MPTTRELTNLECVVLAQVWRMGPCTAHQIRRSFADSTAGRYSDSAGSIYPTLKRLEGRKLLTARPGFKGAQRRTDYSSTKKGRAAVQRWLFSLETREIFPDDPLRTRLIYLDALDADAQEAWLADAVATLHAQRRAVREEYGELAADDVINRLIIENLEETFELRLRLLERARKLRRKKGRLTIGAAAGATARYRPISGKSDAT